MPDYSVMLNYVELLLELPWEEYSQDNFDLKKVKAVLDEDHYGLDDVKGADTGTPSSIENQRGYESSDIVPCRPSRGR